MADLFTRDDVERLLGSAERKVARQILDVLALVRSEIDIDEIAQLLTLGRVEQAATYAVAAAGRFSTAIRDEAYLAAAQEMADRLEAGLTGVIIDFDTTNERAVNRMRATRLRLVQNFDADQRAMVREVFTQAVRDGLNPNDSARRIRDSIGLTERQARAVDNFRRLLREGSSEALRRELRDKRFDRTVARSIRDGEALTEDQINRMVGRYEDRYRQYRSRVIARTETLRAVHEGAEDMIDQAIEDGDVDSEEIVREWITARDERVRFSHSFMDGQQRTQGEPFISGDGNELMYPGDFGAPAADTIQCRCVVTTRLEPGRDRGSNIF